jgi:outer membrane receptor for ferrienterochelin and colicin
MAALLELEDAGEVTVRGGTPLTAPYPAVQHLPLQRSYQLTEDVGLRFGVDNLFNKSPPLGVQTRTDGLQPGASCAAGGRS